MSLKIECVSFTYMTSVFIGDLQGKSQRGGGWQGERGAGCGQCLLHAVYIYL